MSTKLDQIKSTSPNYRSFTGSGERHCLLKHTAFYSESANGVHFRDWVADLAEGIDIPNVHCQACWQPSDQA